MTEEVKNEIAKQNDHSLVQYGDTDEIHALGKRIRLMMPGGSHYTENEALMLAQLAIAHNLNPFNGEVWLIKNIKTGEALGAIIGIKGLRKQAKRQATNWGVGDNGGFRHIIDPEELKKYNCTSADTVYEYTMSDEVTQKRWIEGLTSLRAAKFDQNDAREMMGQNPPVTRGIGVFKAGDRSKMKPNQCAMFRAEKDALKRRFDVDFIVSLPTADGEVLSRDPAFEGMTASDFEKVMGIEETDERDRLPPTSYDKPKGKMMGFDPDEVNGSSEVLDLEFDDDSALPSEPALEVSVVTVKNGKETVVAEGIPVKETVDEVADRVIEEIEQATTRLTEKPAEPILVDKDAGIEEIGKAIEKARQEESSFSRDIKADGTPREPEASVNGEPKPKKKGKLPPNPLKGKTKPIINKNRPYSPSGLSDAVEKWVEKFDKACTQEHRDFLNRTLLTMFDGDNDAVVRVCEHLTGQPDALSMEDGYVQALLQAWMEISDWKGIPSNVSIIEGKALNNHLRGSVDQGSFISIDSPPVEE